jgi:hypothetical protein
MKTYIYLWYAHLFLYLHWILLRNRNISNKTLWHITTQIECSVIFFPQKSCRLWHNVERYGTARQATNDIIIWRIRFAYWYIRLEKHTQNMYYLLLFPLQQWLQERVSVLGYTHIACLFFYLCTVLVVTFTLLKTNSCICFSSLTFTLIHQKIVKMFYKSVIYN